MSSHSSTPTVFLLVVVLVFIFAGWGIWTIESRLIRKRLWKIATFVVSLVLLLWVFLALIGVLDYVYASAHP